MKIRAWTAACMAAIFLLGTRIPCLAIGSDLMSEVPSEASEVVADTAWYTNDTKQSEYAISSAEELLGFAELLAREVTFSEQTVKLTADIVLNEAELSSLSDSEKEGLIPWPPISENGSFQGTIDGQGHTVSGIYYDAPSYDYVGLFGNILLGGDDQKVTVRDLTVVNSLIEVSHSSCRVGALFGSVSTCANGLELRNLYVDVDIRCEKNPNSLGGLVGRLRDPLVIDSCIFAGELSAAALSVTEPNYGMGGLVGYSSDTVTVIDSGVFGMLTCSSGAVGGLVGGCSSSLSVTTSVVDAVISCEGDSVSAFYGTTGTVTLTNTLYTEGSPCPIPNASSENEKGQYEKVASESLWGTEAMSILSRYGWSRWRAVKDGLILPRGLTVSGAESEDDTAFCTKLVGYQTAKTENGTLRLRLVAVVDSLHYSAVGFSVKAYGDAIGVKEADKTSATVYASLLGEVDGTVIQYTAEDLGGAYIFALNINNIPSNAGEITFEAVTYHVKGGEVVTDGSVKKLTLNTDDIA